MPNFIWHLVLPLYWILRPAGLQLHQAAPFTYDSCQYQDLADNTRNTLLSPIASWWNLPCGAVFSQISFLFTFSSIPTTMIRVIIICCCSQFLFRFLLGFLSPKKSVLNLLLCLKGLINLLFHVLALISPHEFSWYFRSILYFPSNPFSFCSPFCQHAFLPDFFLRSLLTWKKVLFRTHFFW